MKKYLALIQFTMISLTISAQSIVNDKYISYNSDGFINEEKTKASNQDILIERKRYLNDLTGLSTCTNPSSDVYAYRLLVNKNIISSPLETYSVIVKTGTVTEMVTRADLLTYYTNIPYPKAKYSLETTVPLSSFTPVFVNSNCALSIPAYYKLQETYDAYDNYGNLLQKTLKSGKKYSLIYGYKGSSCSAIVSNASCTDIAYSSFEGMDDKGNWNYISHVTQLSDVFAGKYCYDLNNGSVSTTNSLSPKKYIVSYWVSDLTPGSVNIPSTVSVKTGESVRGWTYKEHVVQLNNVSPIFLSGSSYIDDLRLYPYGAQMETYVYEPLVGATSKCDMNSKIVFYEYDQLRRVTLVRDQNKKIIKKTEYGLQSND